MLNSKRKEWLSRLALVTATAFAIRLLYLYQVSKSPTFLIPLVDSKSYHDAACKLATSGAVDIQFFWQSFFYPLFLSGVYALTHCSILAAKLIQSLLGAIVCGLVYELGSRIFDRRTALPGALATALYGPLIFFGGELLATVWACLWVLVLLLLLLGSERKGSIARYAAIGLVGGALVITRAPFLPFLVAAAVWLGVVRSRTGAGVRTLIAMESALLVGFLAVAVPVAALNHRTTGIASPLPETGPINLYIGNNAERSEIMAIRPGGEWEKVTLMPVREGYRTKALAQRYYMKKVADYVTHHPLDFFWRLARKTVHFFSSREIPNNTDIYANRAYSSLYSILLWKKGKFGFPFGVLLPFAIVGLVCQWKRIPMAVRLLLVLYPLSIILVFVTARYRAPIVPVLSVVGAAGFWSVVDSLRAARRRTVAGLVVLVLALPVLSSIGGPFAAERVNFEAEKKHFASFYYRDRGDLDEAAALLRRSIELEPDYSDAYQSLGIIYVRQEKLSEAERCFKKAIELRPDYYSAHNNLGALLGRQGRYEEALTFFERAMELNPHSESIYANMAIALVELGRHEEAAWYFKKALFYADAFGNRELADKIRRNFGRYLDYGGHM